MKIRICHFREPIPVCGAWAPRSINLKANTDKGYVTSMRADFTNRLIWLMVTGHRAPGEMRGELAVPMELARLIVPEVEEVVPVVVQKGSKKEAHA